jgi:hypothetical protein
MASTVNSELYNATLLIAKSLNNVSRLLLASIRVGSKTNSDKVFSVYLYRGYSFYDRTLLIPHSAERNKRKCIIGSNLHEANITPDISTNYVLELAIEANTPFR